jgi:hypothetical protein
MVATSSNPDKRVSRYLQFYTWRLNGMSEDDITRSLRFGLPQALYQTLNQDGFPVCPVCGETPAGPKHCKAPKTRKPKPSDGKIVELPPAANAIPLFEWVIGAPPDDKELQKPWPHFASGLHALCEDLRDLEEELHGKRFVSNSVSRPESDPPFETLRQEDFSEEEWARVCEQYGQSDAGEELNYYETPEAPSMRTLGATPKSPWSALVILIGTYLLMGRPVDSLLEVLHPDPSLLVWDQPEDQEQRKAREQLEKKINQLELMAQQVASLVRGGTVGAGSPTEELSREELELAYEITEMKEKDQNLSYDQIYERLRDRELEYAQQDIELFGGSPQDIKWKYSKQDIENLGKHNARRPDFRSPAPDRERQ